MIFYIKIKDGDHKSQIVTLGGENQEIIKPISDVWYNNFNNFNIDKYLGREVYVEYLDPSRIDGQPIFILDSEQIDRDDKISQVLN